MTDNLAPGASAAVAETPAPKESRPVRWIPIAPGSSPTMCDLRRAVVQDGKPATCTDMIYFSEKSAKTGKRQPISMKHPGAVAPTAGTWGQGISHFADCPYAASHRSVKK